jgi:hypothetical protein
MKKHTYLSCVLLGLCFAILSSVAHAQTAFKPGFDKGEFLELLKISSRQGDSLYNPALPAPQQFKMIYRSPAMGFDNRWDLWISENKTVCISIRGTTVKEVSWLDNFYAAMSPAQGTLKISDDFVYDYKLSHNPKAAVHTGWLISTAFLSRDIAPKIDSLFEKGFRDFYIMGHSQGGAIAYLLTASFLIRQENGELPKDITFKTYCSAAPKPGNLYFAYDFENMTKGGWALTVINAADWVPQAPFSIQTVPDFTEVNPFTNAKSTIKNQPLLKRLVMNRVYNGLVNPTKKANRRFQKYLGKVLEKYVRLVFPEFESPEYINTNNYVRTGQQIVLAPNSDYYTIFPQDRKQIWTNHMFEAYLYLTEVY